MTVTTYSQKFQKGDFPIIVTIPCSEQHVDLSSVAINAKQLPKCQAYRIDGYQMWIGKCPRSIFVTRYLGQNSPKSILVYYVNALSLRNAIACEFSVHFCKCAKFSEST